MYMLYVERMGRIDDKMKRDIYIYTHMNITIRRGD